MGQPVLTSRFEKVSLPSILSVLALMMTLLLCRQQAELQDTLADERKIHQTAGDST